MVKCIISSPLDTYSGYGKRSLDLIKELIKQYPEWDIKLLSQRWGNCRMGFLQDHKEKILQDRIIDSIKEQPDVWIQITVPNEFKAVGKFNVGITAGIETTLCDYSWIQGCNRMNLILVSSEHAKRSLIDPVYVDTQNNNPLKVTVPVETLFEGVDLTKYISTGQESNILSEIIPDWNFICVGHWMQGVYGEDRKNIAYTVKAFLEVFKDKEKAPGLILKTSQGSASIVDREEILARLDSIIKSVEYRKSLPKIYLLHGDLTDEEMNALYNDSKVKAMISLTKGEGFGRPLIEFATIGKPVVCSGWSGQLDFLSKDNTLFVGGTLKNVHPSAVIDHVILKEAKWFCPEDKQVCAALQEVFYNYSFWRNKAEQQAEDIKQNFSLELMGSKIKDILSKHIKVHNR